MSDELELEANAVLSLPQDLEGDWYNELQSQMQLKVQGNKLTGRYNTKVGDAQGWYDLVGLMDARDKTSQAVAFVVSWQNAYKTTGAATSWCGQLQRDKAGRPIIVTTWLLTEETKPADDWASTKVGQDTFTRTPPTADDSSRAYSVVSHPAAIA